MTVTRGGIACFFLAVWCACSTSTEDAAAPASAPSSFDAAPPEDAANDARAATVVDAASDASDAGEKDAGALAHSEACIAHCNVIVTGCAKEGYPQFGSMTQCLHACYFYPVGGPDDWSTQADTLGCREHHTGTAVMGGGYHCFHGGPYGYGSCGSQCTGFCRLAMAWCAGSAGGAPFASLAACATECEAWPWAPPGADGLDIYRPHTPTSGDTIQCREVMLVKSLESAAARDQYCPLAATTSATCK